MCKAIKAFDLPLLVNDLKLKIHNLETERDHRDQENVTLKVKLENLKERYGLAMIKSEAEVNTIKSELNAFINIFQRLDVVLKEFVYGEQGSLSSCSSSTNVLNSSSQAKLDHAYVTGIRYILASDRQRTKLVQNDVSKHNRISKRIQRELQEQNEDLSLKLQCRDTTIASLEQSLAKMKEQRFTRKCKGRHRANVGRNNTRPMPSICSQNFDNKFSCESLHSSLDNNSSTNAISTEDSSSDTISLAVEEARAEMEEEHVTAINNLKHEMNSRLDEKDDMIETLQNKMDAIVKHQANKRNLILNSGTRDDVTSKNIITWQNSSSISIRSFSVANERLEVNTRNLDALLNRLEETKQGQQYDDGTRAEIAHLASKLSTMQQEIKITMHLLKLKHKNSMETIRQSKLPQSHVNEIEVKKILSSYQNNLNNFIEFERKMKKEMNAIMTRLKRQESNKIAN
mmetsp:Transcript_15843/g.22559  ORF Transcript_15843/g.22559 Transcript_15843/m.22559 type:complete len:457 (-) Transcript_15843:4-1374(-)